MNHSLSFPPFRLPRAERGGAPRPVPPLPHLRVRRLQVHRGALRGGPHSPQVGRPPLRRRQEAVQDRLRQGGVPGPAGTGIALVETKDMTATVMMLLTNLTYVLSGSE